MLKLGVTGGIGSGKSHVCRILEESFGLPVYDCDSQAKHLMNRNTKVRRELIKLMGPSIYAGNGKLRSVEVAKKIFADRSLLEQVNAIVHPKVRTDCMAWCLAQEAQGIQAVAVESALLHTSGINQDLNCVLRITAPHELRISRVMNRDHCCREQVEDRMRNQVAEEQAPVDFLLENDGVQSVHEQLRHILEQFPETRNMFQND